MTSHAIVQNEQRTHAPTPEIEDILAGFGKGSALPGYLRISVVDYCNERCFFCHNEGVPVMGQRLDSALLYKVINASLALGKTKVKFTGGEPLLEPDLEAYIAYVKRQCPSSEVGIITNGVGLERRAAALKQAGLDTLSFSLHALDSKLYKSVTDVDALSSALAGLDAAKAAGISLISINAVVGKRNISQLEPLVRYCAERGYRLRILDILPTNEFLAQERLSTEELTAHVGALNGASHGQVEVKPNLYHDKCVSCDARDKCGENEYLRLSTSGLLLPCMYRPDLVIPVSVADTPHELRNKVALGFRRIRKDDR